MQLTEAQVLALAPDPGTADRARQMAHAWRWFVVAGNERAVWGEHGDRANPFQTAVDLTGPAFKCNCPVRRLPCKHGVGLLLLAARGDNAFSVKEPPDWVAEWLAKRDVKAGKTGRTVAAAPSLEEITITSPPGSRLPNLEKRLFQMSAGLAELESWFADLLRQGLAAFEGQAESYCQELAARMVDAKLGGLARRIRQFPSRVKEAGVAGSKNGWHERLLAEISDIYLIVKGFQRIDKLPPPLQDDLLSLAGVNFKKEDVLAQTGIRDRWLVAGQTEEVEDVSLLARRTWLVGERSGHTGMLLEFSFGGAGYETTWRLGSVLHGELVFYPSAFPLRGLFKSFEWSDKPFDLPQGYATFDDFAKSYARALGANPWLSPFPVLLENVIPVYQKDRFLLVDAQRKQLSLLASDDLGWKLVATSGGRPIHVFGQWAGETVFPLSAMVNGQFRAMYLMDSKV